jgi:membrane protease FtsH catalytic subunit (EC 3.4.24.-)
MNKEQVHMADFEEAKDKVLMGKERRSVILSDEEKKTTAYHEAGHALAAKLLPGTDPVHKVSIIPRGMALGVTMQLPVDDRHNYSKEFLENQLAMMLGGRVAEELVLNQKTTGASNDIDRATKTARKMVCQWGMSDKLGPLSFGDGGEQIFLGRELIQHKNYSEDTARTIDDEIRGIIDQAHAKARTLIGENRAALDRIAEALLERETISGDDIDLLIKGEPLPPLNAERPGGGSASSGSGSGPGYVPRAEGKPATGDSDEFSLEEDEGDDGKKVQ